MAVSSGDNTLLRKEGHRAKDSETQECKLMRKHGMKFRLNANSPSLISNILN